MTNIITRAEAHAKGLKRYNTGQPCRRGHLRERIVSTGACMGCLAAYASKYRRDRMAPTLGLVPTQHAVHPDHADRLAAFAELLRLCVVNGTAPPLVPTLAEIATVNVLLASMRPDVPAPPARPSAYDTWVRIHGRDVADQMLGNYK